MNLIAFVRRTMVLIAVLLGIPLLLAGPQSTDSATVGLASDNVAPRGFISLFNGQDFTGWKVPAGDGGHWKVIDGVIDYDAESEAEGDKSL